VNGAGFGVAAHHQQGMLTNHFPVEVIETVAYLIVPENAR